MTGKEYLTAQITMIELAKRAQKINYDDFLKGLSNAEAALPNLKAELRDRAQANMDACKELAIAFQMVKEKMDRLGAMLDRPNVVLVETEKKENDA